MTPSGRHKDELAEEDLVVVRLGHDDALARSPSGLRPSSDLAIHLAVYRARPDVGAVVHAHPAASMALTVAGEVPDPSLLPETETLLPRLPFVPFGAPGSAELAERIAASLNAPPDPPPNAVLLERHGAIAVGRDPIEAADRLELVEVLCRTWRDVLLIRAARSALGMVTTPSPGQ